MYHVYDVIFHILGGLFTGTSCETLRVEDLEYDVGDTYIIFYLSDWVTGLVDYVSVSCEEGEMQTAAGEKPELNIQPVVLNSGGATRPYIQVWPLYVGLDLQARGIC